MLAVQFWSSFAKRKDWNQSMQAGDRRTKVVMEKDQIVKTGPPAIIALEAAKTRHARQIGLECGLFEVPEILHHNENDGVLVQKRIHNFGNFLRLAAHGSPKLEIWTKLGNALGIIHNNLRPNSCPSPDIPERWREHKGPLVWLHGDFNLANLGYVDQPDNLVILDWSLTPTITGLGGIGPNSFDLAWMIKSFFFLPCKFLLQYKAEEKADKFIAGYLQTSQFEICFPELVEYSILAAQHTCESQAKGLVKHTVYGRFSDRLGRYLQSETFQQ